MAPANLLALVSRLLLRKDSRPASSPISAMPPEILSEIFVELIAQIPLHEWQTTLTSLCLVCHAWKIAAYNEPRLWTALFLGLKPTNGINALPSLEPFVSHIFGRAGAFPLHLAIGNLDVGLGNILGSDTLSSRISSLDLEEVYLGRDNLRSSWDWSRLSTLKVHFPTGITRPFSAKSLPRLVNLDLETTLIKKWTDQFPWSQLIRLRIKSCSQDDGLVLNILKQCVSLEECSTSLSLPIPKEAGPISLPKLRSLALRITYIGPCTPNFTGPFHAPALESLRFTLLSPSRDKDPPGRLFTALCSILTPLRDTLRTLHLRGTHLTEIETILLLLPLGALRSLSLYTCLTYRKFLLFGTSNNSFLPNLRVLKLKMGFTHDTDLQRVLFRFVNARAACSTRDGGTSACNAAKLESFSFNFYRPGEASKSGREFLQVVRAYGPPP